MTPIYYLKCLVAAIRHWDIDFAADAYWAFRNDWRDLQMKRRQHRE